MSIINSAGEAERKENLRKMEDARLAFAERMAQEGFNPETMILVCTERGGLIGLAKHAGDVCLVIGPEFGQDGEFVLERYASPDFRREEIFEESQGLGGIFGMGKKGAAGFTLTIDREGVDFAIPFVINRNSAAIFRYRKNPLLSTKRRRNNANVVWEIQPLDRPGLAKIETELSRIIGA